jgi:hypothetical protein
VDTRCGWLNRGEKDKFSDFEKDIFDKIEEYEAKLKIVNKFSCTTECPCYASKEATTAYDSYTEAYYNQNGRTKIGSSTKT